MVYENNEAVFEVVDATAIEAAQQASKRNWSLDLCKLILTWFLYRTTQLSPLWSGINSYYLSKKNWKILNFSWFSIPGPWLENSLQIWRKQGQCSGKILLHLVQSQPNYGSHFLVDIWQRKSWIINHGFSIILRRVINVGHQLSYFEVWNSGSRRKLCSSNVSAAIQDCIVK